MEEEMRNIVVDVSSFMLIEATGDSELDSNNYRTSTDPLDVQDDDAMSICSCTSDQSYQGYDDDYLKMDFNSNDDFDDHEDDATSSASCCRVDGKVSSFDNDSEEEDEDEDDGDVVEQRWIGHGGVHHKKSTKARNCADLAKEKLKNKKDDDSLFWETCLAS